MRTTMAQRTRTCGLFACLLMAGWSCDALGQNAIAGAHLDWPVPGGASDETHFSPVEQISTSNVSRLRPAWYHDLPVSISAIAEPV